MKNVLILLNFFQTRRHGRPAMVVMYIIFVSTLPSTPNRRTGRTTRASSPSGTSFSKAEKGGSSTVRTPYFIHAYNYCAIEKLTRSVVWTRVRNFSKTVGGGRVSYKKNPGNPVASVPPRVTILLLPYDTTRDPVSDGRER